MTTIKAFGLRLAQERRHKAVVDERDILKKDVAKAVGASESSVGRWEAGLIMPEEPMILRLAKYYGVTPAWLRYGTEPRQAPASLVGTEVEDPRPRLREAKNRRA